MMRAVWLVVVGILCVGAEVVPVFGHHSFAPEFDNTKPVVLKGTISKVEWTNPHAWLWVDVKDAAGAVTAWSFEMGSPFALLRGGWKRDDIKPGTEVQVSGYRARSGLPVANASIIKLPDGRDLFSPSGAPDAPKAPAGKEAY
jgi:hypothetical protein